jgi:hypothetical protein
MWRNPFHKPVFMVKSLYRGTLTTRYHEVLCSFGYGLPASALEMGGDRVEVSDVLWRKLRSTFSCDSLKTLVTSRVRSREVTNAEYRVSSHVVTHTVDNFFRHFLLFKKCASAYHFLAPPYCLHPHCHLPLSHHHHSLCPSQSRTATTAPPRRQIHCQSTNLQQLFSGLMHGPW